MFIELTDHLRCPAEHEESFLVLIPDRLEGREVLGGILGCPVCHQEYPIVRGVVEFGVPEQVALTRPDPALAEALETFLGIEGPGGYVGLMGEAGALAEPLASRLPGIHLGVVNPPAGIVAGAGRSILESPRNPFKARALRGVVLSAPYATDPRWQREAIGAVLPGLRIVGAGPAPLVDALELLAEAGGWWVGRKK